MSEFQNGFNLKELPIGSVTASCLICSRRSTFSSYEGMSEERVGDFLGVCPCRGFIELLKISKNRQLQSYQVMASSASALVHVKGETGKDERKLKMSVDLLQSQLAILGNVYDYPEFEIDRCGEILQTLGAKFNFKLSELINMQELPGYKIEVNSE